MREYVVPVVRENPDPRRRVLLDTGYHDRRLQERLADPVFRVTYAAVRGSLMQGLPPVSEDPLP